MQHENWKGFIGGAWQDSIDVRDFIQRNYREYTGDASFLASATPRTKAMMEKVQALFKAESPGEGPLRPDVTRRSRAAAAVVRPSTPSPKGNTTASCVGR